MRKVLGEGFLIVGVANCTSGALLVTLGSILRAQEFTVMGSSYAAGGVFCLLLAVVLHAFRRRGS